MGLWSIIKSYLHDTDYLLDMETGGGEFLLSFSPILNRLQQWGCNLNIKLCEGLTAPGMER